MKLAVLSAFVERSHGRKKGPTVGWSCPVRTTRAQPLRPPAARQIARVQTSGANPLRRFTVPVCRVSTIVLPRTMPLLGTNRREWMVGHHFSSDISGPYRRQGRQQGELLSNERAGYTPPGPAKPCPNRHSRHSPGVVITECVLSGRESRPKNDDEYQITVACVLPVGDTADRK
jgi:hypothetical protein